MAVGQFFLVLFRLSGFLRALFYAVAPIKLPTTLPLPAIPLLSFPLWVKDFFRPRGVSQFKGCTTSSQTEFRYLNSSGFSNNR